MICYTPAKRQGCGPQRSGNRKQRGMALAETVLAIAVGAAMLMGIAHVMRQGQSDLRARTLAEQQQAFMNAAGNFYLANSAKMLAAMADGTEAADWCVVGADPATGVGGTVSSDATLRTCALDADWLKWKQAIPAGFKSVNAHNQRWVAIFKRVYEGATPTDAVEMLVVGANDEGNANSVRDMRELQSAANLVGGAGGYVPDTDRVVCTYSADENTYEACGTQGGWKVDLRNFVNTL